MTAQVLKKIYHPNVGFIRDTRMLKTVLDLAALALHNGLVGHTFFWENHMAINQTMSEGARVELGGSWLEFKSQAFGISNKPDDVDPNGQDHTKLCSNVTEGKIIGAWWSCQEGLQFLSDYKSIKVGLPDSDERSVVLTINKNDDIDTPPRRIVIRVHLAVTNS